MAFCAKDQNREFPRNVERNAVLSEVKRAARILLQLLKPSGRLYDALWSFLGLLL